jgi:hypothetical protein
MRGTFCTQHPMGEFLAQGSKHFVYRMDTFNTGQRIFAS